LVIYGHVDKSTVTVRKSVTKGQLIAEIATAYNSNLYRNPNNDHLHFGINVNSRIDYISNSNESWGFGIARPVATLTQIYNHGFRDPFEYISNIIYILVPIH